MRKRGNRFITKSGYSRRRKGEGSFQKRNGIWYFIQYVDGRVLSRSCKTRDRMEAERYAADLRVPPGSTKACRIARVKSVMDWMVGDDGKHDPTLKEGINNYFNHPKNVSQSYSAQETDTGRWNFFMWWLHGHNKPRSRINANGAHPEIQKMSGVTASVATEFVRFAKSMSSPSTVNRYIRVLKRIWTLNDMEKNPWADFGKIPVTPHQRRAFTRAEIELMIEKGEGEIRTLFTLGPYTGMRLSDCAHLKWECIDSELSVISVVPHKTMHSSGKRVQIPIHRKLREALVEAQKWKKGSDGVYVMPEIAQYPKWKLSNAAQAHFVKCGLSESEKSDGYRRRTAVVGFHGFRSTFITMMAEVGAPLAMVQSIVGHMTSELTMLYYRSDTERARTYIDKL